MKSQSSPALKCSNLGIGLGLRDPHLPEILDSKPKVPWFEVLGDNYLGRTGISLRGLEKLRQDYPITLHFVGMSIGSSDPINYEYLRQVRDLKVKLEPLWTSDHLCWSSVHGIHLHNLLPLPYTEETVSYIAKRIEAIQDFLQCKLVIENVSSYLRYELSTMAEWDFVSSVSRESDCYLLVDISNIFVNSVNQNFDYERYLAGLPADRIVQLHLGGYKEQAGYILDDHGGPISDAALSLYRKAVSLWGPRSTIIEWDEDIPSFEALSNERIRVEYEVQHRDVMVA